MTEPTEQLKQRLTANGHAKIVESAKIEKTDSVVNLTKPSLYSIYNENSEIALNKDEEIDDNEPSLYPTQTAIPNEQEEYEPLFDGPFHIFAAKILIKCVILAACVGLYNGATKYIKTSHIKIDTNTFQPLYLSETMFANTVKFFNPVTRIFNAFGVFNVNPIYDYLVLLFIQGTIMGCLVPLIDYSMPKEQNYRIFSSNPDPRKRYVPSVLFNEILRLIITFLGVSYAIRHIEWASPFQVSAVWSCLDPILWLLLDGTTGGFLGAISITGYGGMLIYFTNLDLIKATEMGFPDKMALWLWIGSYFFCGIIIFGKIGRALF